MFARPLKSLTSVRLLGVLALFGSATVAHAHPETATQPDQPLDAMVSAGLEHAAGNPIKLPKVKKKKKSLPDIQTKDEPEKQKIPLPSSPSGADAVKQYKQSSKLLDKKDAKVKAAIESVATGELDSSADAITGVPIPADLDPLRRSIIDRARGELGKVDENPSKPIKVTDPWTNTTFALKGGFERLAEYNAVAYGSNVGAWANENTLRNIVQAGKKHDSWCGIFAVWAVKVGADVMANNYSDVLQAAIGKDPLLSVLVALFASHFTPQPGGYLPNKYTYLSLQWGPGAMFVYAQDTNPFDFKEDKDPNDISIKDGEVRYKLSPTGIGNWLSQKQSVPPIKPGDIGYTREQNKAGGTTYHHYIIERILEVDGKYIYFTIEGNYWSLTTKKEQAIVRNYRVYVPGYDHTTNPWGRNVIEAWYDVEELPRYSNNRHMKDAADQP